MRLDGPRHPPAGGAAPARIVLLLHGYGADGNDLIGLASAWAPAMPDTLFAAPHAPFPCEGAPFGRQWFGIHGRTDALRLAGLRAASAMVDGLIDDLLEETGLPPAALILAGFSQGTMLALHTGPPARRAAGGHSRLFRAFAGAGIAGAGGAGPAAGGAHPRGAGRSRALLRHGRSGGGAGAGRVRGRDAPAAGPGPRHRSGRDAGRAGVHGADRPAVAAACAGALPGSVMDCHVLSCGRAGSRAMCHGMSWSVCA